MNSPTSRICVRLCKLLIVCVEYSCLQNSCPHHLLIRKKLKIPKNDVSVLTSSSDSHLAFLVLYQALYDPMTTIVVQRSLISWSWTCHEQRAAPNLLADYTQFTRFISTQNTMELHTRMSGYVREKQARTLGRL